MQRRSYILAVDLGTSALKVALVSTDGQVTGSDTEPISLKLQGDGGAEQDPEEWWSAIIRATQRLLARGPVPREWVVGIGCTAQWSGTVPVDASGKALGNAIIWMDSRGAPEVQRATGGPVSIEGYGVDKLFHWIRKTGGIPGHSGKDSIAHVLYIKRHRPDLYRAAHKFLEPKDYLNLRFTGRCLASYDSITLHWLTDNRDVTKVKYDDVLLRLTGLERDKFPDLVPASSVIGPILPEIAEVLGLSPDVQVAAGTPDIHSAALGSGATRDGEAHLYVGTSSWLTCHVPFKKTDLVRNMASLPSAVPGRYFVANEQETAGACLSFLRDRLLFYPDGLTNGDATDNGYDRFDALASQVPPGSGGLVFTPWLYGERTPVEDHSVRGGFFNMSLDTTRPQLIRSVLEGVALNSRWLLEAVEHFVGKRLDPIRMIGGGAKSEVWCQIFADILDRSILQVEDPVQANVRGVGIASAVSLGYMSYDDVPGRVAVAREFEPNRANRAIYDRVFRTFLDIYRRNKRIYARLNNSHAAN